MPTRRIGSPVVVDGSSRDDHQAVVASTQGTATAAHDDDDDATAAGTAPAQTSRRPKTTTVLVPGATVSFSVPACLRRAPEHVPGHARFTATAKSGATIKLRARAFIKVRRARRRRNPSAR